MQDFDTIHARAAARKGGADALDALLPSPTDPADLARLGDDRILSLMAKCVFQAGFSWKVIENKWPGFEEAFHGFQPKPVAYMSDESLEAQLKNAAIVRNWQKIKSIRDNAQFVVELAEEHGSAAKFFADWPGTDQIDLMAVLKKRASRLSGTTGQYFLRFLGKDSFVLSKSVVAALIEDGVVDKAPTSKSALASVQEAFNAWQTESGRPLTQISRVLAMSVDA